MKRTVSLLLALLMLLCTAACAKNPADPADSGSGDSVGDTTPAETTADPLADNLPAETFNGEEIHVWIDNMKKYQGFDIETEMIDGDIIDETIVARNETVATRFDVTWRFDRDKGGASGYRDLAVLRQSILGGDEYDIIEGVSSYQCPLAMYGCYIDFATNDYVDLTKSWYLPYATEALRIGDRQYLASGFYEFTTFERTEAFFFNANMVDEYQLGNLYDLVENDEWTWEKMIELCEIVSEDVNQDGVYDQNDNFGCHSRYDFWMSLPATAGYQFTTVKDDGTIQVTGLNDVLQNMHEKVYPFITNNNMYWSGYTYGVHGSYSIAAPADRAGKEMFCNDQILFSLNMMSWTGTDQLREFGAYGLLPTPKFDESQTYYGSVTTPHVSAICSTTGDYKITSIVYEALQAESYKQLRPAYFEVALSKKYLNDPQAVEMMNLIFQNVSCEWLYCYGGAGISGALNACIATQPNLASYFQSNADTINNQLVVFMDQVANIPEYIPE